MEKEKYNDWSKISVSYIIPEIMNLLTLSVIISNCRSPSMNVQNYLKRFIFQADLARSILKEFNSKRILISFALNVRKQREGL